MKPSKLLSLFTGVFTALLVLSASIAVPLPSITPTLRP